LNYTAGEPRARHAIADSGMGGGPRILIYEYAAQLKRQLEISRRGK